MKRATQTLLYHLLPVVFWLLAIGGSLLPLLPIFNIQYSLFNYIPALLSLLCIVIIAHIKRHSSSVEECFQVAVIMGIASFWLPSVIFLIVPIWGYLIYQNLFSFRAFLATLIGLALVAIWILVLSYFSILTFQFSLAANLLAWIPTGSFLLAWLASTIAQRILRVR